MELYLYEIIEDYKSAVTEEERNEVFRSFCSTLWASSNKRRTRTNTIRFSVRKDLLDTATGKVFQNFTAIRYNGYYSRTKNTDWCSLIRQKINNLYTRYFDRTIILNKDYIHLLQRPRQLYFQWEEGKDMTPEEAASLIQSALTETERKKNIYQNQKMDLSWNEYKKVAEEFLRKIFDNCQRIEDCEKMNDSHTMYDFVNEDNFYIKYFCKSLEGAMQKWEKHYYGIRDHKSYIRCSVCGRLIEKTNNRIKYCKGCATAINRERSRKNMRSKRMFDLEKS